MDETMNAADLSTTSGEPETQQDVPEVSTPPDTAPQDREETADTDAQSAADSAAEQQTATTEESAPEEKPFLVMRYNHEDIPLTEGEARKWAQLGRQYHDRLDYIAAQSDTTPDKLIDAMVDQMEKSYRQSLVEKFGEDEAIINDMMALYHNRQKEKYEQVLSDRRTQEQTAEESRNMQIADAFIALQKEFPELTEYRDLPGDVKKAAAAGEDLMRAYLLHLHRENRRVSAEQKSADEAREAAAGSMHTETDAEPQEVSSFISGLWSS